MMTGLHAAVGLAPHGEQEVGKVPLAPQDCLPSSNTLLSICGHQQCPDRRRRAQQEALISNSGAESRRVSEVIPLASTTVSTSRVRSAWSPFQRLASHRKHLNSPLALDGVCLNQVDELRTNLLNRRATRTGRQWSSNAQPRLWKNSRQDDSEVRISNPITHTCQSNT